MLNRLLFLVVLSLSLAVVGCKNTEEEEEPDPNPDGTVPLTSPTAPRMDDASGDATFMSFVGRLRKAIGNRDRELLRTMMTDNFGYSLNPLLTGPGAFDYWDRNNLWTELELVARDRWQPLGNYMVTPVEFALVPENYRSYRAGATLVNGSWRFAYFVTGE